MKTNKRNVCSTSEIRYEAMGYKSLIKKVSGDLVILGLKDTCKTTLLQHLARTLRAEPQNHIYIMETFPKWINEFDEIAYMTIADSQVQPKENLPYLEQDKSFIQWSKDYAILNASEVSEFLKSNSSGIFLIECEDMEKISAFMTFVIYQIYRKQYLRAKANCLNTTNEHFYFLVEEAHNLLDSTVIAKKTFNKLRKIQNEFRNLKMHMLCVALRLQDLSPKVRSKMQILLAKVSLDDYQLKVRNLLRNSTFRDEITRLAKGKFVFPETDETLETEPFQQIGKPFEWRPTEKPQARETVFDRESYPRPQAKASKLKNVLSLLKFYVWKTESPKTNGKAKLETCESCGRPLTESNRGTTDKELCFECESDRAHEENLGEF